MAGWGGLVAKSKSGIEDYAVARVHNMFQIFILRFRRFGLDTFPPGTAVLSRCSTTGHKNSFQKPYKSPASDSQWSINSSLSSLALRVEQ